MECEIEAHQTYQYEYEGEHEDKAGPFSDSVLDSVNQYRVGAQRPRSRPRIQVTLHSSPYLSYSEKHENVHTGTSPNQYATLNSTPARQIGLASEPSHGS